MSRQEAPIKNLPAPCLHRSSLRSLVGLALSEVLMMCGVRCWASHLAQEPLCTHPLGPDKLLPCSLDACHQGTLRSSLNKSRGVRWPRYSTMQGQHRLLMQCCLSLLYLFDDSVSVKAWLMGKYPQRCSILIEPKDQQDPTNLLNKKQPRMKRMNQSSSLPASLHRLWIKEHQELCCLTLIVMRRVSAYLDELMTSRHPCYYTSSVQFCRLGFQAQRCSFGNRLCLYLSSTQLFL